MDSGESFAFWPWGSRSALGVSTVLLVVLVGGVVVLGVAADWPDARWDGPMLLAAVLLGLVPVGLLVLASVARSRGSVSFRGLSLTFGATAQAVASTTAGSTIAIPRNVTQEGADVGDSGSSEVVRVLQAAGRSDVVVVDLEDGHAWWDSRLLLLCAGATLHGRPRAVVFVATVDGTPRTFVGWAGPADVVDQVCAASAELADAYATARTSLWRAGLTFPGRSTAPGIWPTVAPALPPAPAPDPPGAPRVRDEELFERRGQFLLPEPAAVALTRALGRAVHPLEEAGGARHLSVVALRELLLPVLHTRSTDEDAPDEAWVEAVVGHEDEYLVVTRRGVYRGVAPRQRLVAALIRELALAALAVSTGGDRARPLDADAQRPASRATTGANDSATSAPTTT